jgi:hypothetical protein
VAFARGTWSIARLGHVEDGFLMDPSGL